MSIMRKGIIIFLLITFFINVNGQDTLTVMQYNLLNFGNFTSYCTLSNNDPGEKIAWLKTIIDYQTPDIFCVNEMSQSDYYQQMLLDEVLNTSGRTGFEMAGTTNYNNSDIVNMLYYNGSKLGLESMDAIVTEVRDINIYKLYYKQRNKSLSGDNIVFYCIVAHLKAGSTSGDMTVRAQMTADVTNYLVSHQITEPCLILGDLNLQSSTEQAWLNLTQYADPAYDFSDPAGKVGNWHNNATYAIVHTQSTHITSDGCASGGGMDDRFDFILANAAFFDEEASILVIDGSYDVLGQDGQRLNGSVADPPNYSAPSGVISALYGMSDHLPVTLELKVSPGEQQPCTELFFSEYVEGTGNNKALEIYNPTNTVIDLGSYRIARYGNGNTVPDVVALAGTIQPKQAYVVVIDKRDPNGTGYNTPVDTALMAVADTFLCPDYSVNKTMYFNGNDAMALERTNGILVDLIGKIGENPGDGWTDDSTCAAAPFTDACGAEPWTMNHTLIRKFDVSTGVTHNPAYFNVTLQWDSLPADTFDSLGTHYGQCASVLPESWNYTPTNVAHFFSFPLTTSLTVNDLPLPEGSYLGVFYLDDEQEKCGGNQLYTGEATAVSAYGDDGLTPEKDGFAQGENIIWKVYLPETGEEYYAVASYDVNVSFHDGKFYPFGISVLTALEAYPLQQQQIIVNEGWNGVSSFLQPKWKALENVFGNNLQQIVYMTDGQKTYYPSGSVNDLTDWETNTPYLIKSQSDFPLIIDGISNHRDTLYLNAGWNLLPFLRPCSTTSFGIYLLIGDALVQIKEIAGDKVYWPAKEVGTLEELIPGKAYFILLNEDTAIYFPECD